MFTTMSTVIPVRAHGTVQVVEPLDRHVVAGDPVQGPTAVRRGRVHRQDQARDQTDTAKPPTTSPAISLSAAT